MSGSDGRPGILLLFTDQQRYDTLGAAGFSHMKTPNIDRLVNEGCLFENACTPNPVCIPARHNIITGLPARVHGYPDNLRKPLESSVPALPRILSDNGYMTRAVGKMHFQPPRRHHGFEKMELMEELPVYRENDEYAMYLKSVGLGHIQHIHGVRHLLYMLPQRSLVPEEHHGSKWVADRSIEFLKANYDRPFFLWSSWIAPHPPFDAPDSFAGIYDDVEMPEPLTGEADVPEFMKTRAENYGDIPSREVLMRMRRLYCASLSFVDRQVGRILDCMDEIGILDDTLIIFTSDHGEMLGDFGLYQKSLPFEGVCRIPLIARWPEKFGKGTRRKEFADLNDILPTVLAAAGIEYPGGYELSGGTLLPEGSSKERSCQYVEHGKEGARWVYMRDERYKYVYFYCGKESLYDLGNDPGEKINLISEGMSGEASRVRERLKKKLIEHEGKFGLEGYVKDGSFREFPEPKAAGGRNSQFPRFPLSINDDWEKKNMNSVEDEILGAVKREPLARLSELDFEAWVKNGGSGKFAEKLRREKGDD